MKILAISGSPRKGNTYSALETIKEDFQDIDFEIIQAAIDKIETVVIGDLEDQEYDGSNGCIPAGTVDDLAICFSYDDTIDDESPGVSA